MRLKNRPNIPRAPRFPDARLPAEEFNRAAVEIFKQQYREIVALRNTIHKIEKELERLDAKAKQGSRPPHRYCDTI